MLPERYILAGLLFILELSGNVPAGAQRGKEATITIPTASEMYSGEPQSLTPSHCGVCHPAVYHAVKGSGGRHRFDCQKCHDVPKSHAAGKVTGTAHKPKCASCHDRPHGPKAIRCTECHATPHTPKKIFAEAPIKSLCLECHGSVRDKLAAFNSKHSKIACITCHTSHGFKPSCFTCHKPHQQGQALSTCVACHPAHMPRQVQYGKDLPSDTCGSCHARVYTAWEKGLGKHKAIACVTCHKNRHRTILACSDCHGKPHTAAFHVRFPRCLTCHINVHDIPATPSKAKRKALLQEK
jgi:predicted CXXCH cytochrome family protein